MRRRVVDKDRLKHIEYIDRRRTCYIMYKDKAIGELIEETCSDSGEFDWVIRPYWDVRDSFGDEVYFPGIDEDLRKEEYVRRYVPILVEQRTIPNGREDLREWLDMVDLKTNDLFEFMCRTHSVCSDNRLYISRYPWEVIDVNKKIPFTIPDFDTSEYGWL